MNDNPLRWRPWSPQASTSITPQKRLREREAAGPCTEPLAADAPSDTGGDASSGTPFSVLQSTDRNTGHLRDEYLARCGKADAGPLIPPGWDIPVYPQKPEVRSPTLPPEDRVVLSGSLRIDFSHKTVRHADGCPVPWVKWAEILFILAAAGRGGVEGPVLDEQLDGADKAAKCLKMLRWHGCDAVVWDNVNHVYRLADVAQDKVVYAPVCLGASVTFCEAHGLLQHPRLAPVQLARQELSLMRCLATQPGKRISITSLCEDLSRHEKPLAQKTLLNLLHRLRQQTKSFRQHFRIRQQLSADTVHGCWLEILN